MDISFMKGRVLLENLQLNNKILDGLPVPLKMKYGRIGRIEIKLPSLFEIAKAQFKVEVKDIFICLT